MRSAGTWPALFLSVLFAASCATKNVGHGVAGDPCSHTDPYRFTVNAIVLSPPGPHLAGSALTATIDFASPCGPYSGVLTFADCVEPPVHEFTVPHGESTATIHFTLEAFTTADDPDGKACGVTANVTDANGSLATVSASFHVDPLPNLPAVVQSRFDPADCSIELTVDDPEGERVTITPVTLPAGVIVSPGPFPHELPDGHGTVRLEVGVSDLFVPAGGTVELEVSDGYNTVPVALEVNCPPIVVEPDTLYAIPLQTAINAGERVRIVLVTGALPQPFKYMHGVCVTIDQASGARYVGSTRDRGGTGDVPGSFNVGSPGGAAGDVDGIWEHMDPPGFLLAPDNFHVRTDVGGGLYGFDFNVTPIDTDAQIFGLPGALCSFELQLDNPGTYQLGFELFEVADRTFYTDENTAPNRYWGDISNSHPGVPHTITVN